MMRKLKISNPSDRYYRFHQLIEGHHAEEKRLDAVNYDFESRC